MHPMAMTLTFFFLVSLIEVLQDNCNVHIDNNHITDNDERREIGDGEQWMSAIPI